MRAKAEILGFTQPEHFVWYAGQWGRSIPIAPWRNGTPLGEICEPSLDYLSCGSMTYVIRSSLSWPRQVFPITLWNLSVATCHAEC
jgi:hypothetical protein